MASSVQLDPLVLKSIKGKTVIVTGAAGGIGAHICRLFAENGANVVVADMEYTRATAQELIQSLPDPSKAIFIATNIIDWGQMQNLFKQSIAKFGSVEFVIANAGVMESKSAMDLDEVDENGDLVEASEVNRVIDINLKGTLNSKFSFVSTIGFENIADSFGFSHSIGYASYEEESAMFRGWFSRLSPPCHFDVWVLRSYWSRRIHIFKTRCHGPFACVASPCDQIWRTRQWRISIFHSFQNVGQLFKGLGGKEAASKYSRGCCRSHDEFGC